MTNYYELSLVSLYIYLNSVADLFTFDVIGRVGFGVDMSPQTDPDSPFSKYGRKIFFFNFLKPVVVLNCKEYNNRQMSF